MTDLLWNFSIWKQLEEFFVLESCVLATHSVKEFTRILLQHRLTGVAATLLASILKQAAPYENVFCILYA